MKPLGLGLFNGTTGHTTSNQGASVKHTFTGNAISLFGSVGPQNSPYNVTLDDWPTQTLNATRIKFEPQTVLFYADNIGHGTHVLTLINAGDMNLDIDYAVVHHSMPSHNPDVPKDSPPQDSFHLHPGAIAGLAAGIFVIISLLFSLWLLSRRNNTLWTRLQRGYMVQSQFDVSALNSVDSLGSGYSPAVAMHKSYERNAPVTNDGGVTEARRPFRAPSQLSSASTLVAEDGSNVGYPRRMKLVPNRPVNWSFNTSNSHIRISSTRNLLDESESLRIPEEEMAGPNTDRPPETYGLNVTPVTHGRRTL